MQAEIKGTTMAVLEVSLGTRRHMKNDPGVARILTPCPVTLARVEPGRKGAVSEGLG